MEIRAFRPEDRAAIVEIENRDRPAHRHRTVAEWEHWDALRSPAEVSRRLVIGTPAVAYLDAVDLDTSDTRQPGVCDMELLVAHEHRRQGLGAALYEEALRFAGERGCHRLVTWFTLRHPDEPAVPFLQKCGFSELDREQPSYLNLDTFEPARFVAAVGRVEAAGVRLLSYADLSDTAENRRRLYALCMPIERDMPIRDDEPYIDPPFEEWQKHFEQPEWDHRTLLLAESEGAWIGVTQLGLRPDGVAETWITGVLPPHRGRGIALALKVSALEMARSLGIHTVTTENHEENGPMLAINRKLGFIPEAPQVSYNKVLREPQEQP